MNLAKMTIALRLPVVAATTLPAAGVAAVWAQRNSPLTGLATTHNKAIDRSMSNLEDKEETDLSGKEWDETGKNKNQCFVHTRPPIPAAQSLSQQAQVAGGQFDFKTAMLTEWMATGMEEATLAIDSPKSMHALDLPLLHRLHVPDARLTSDPLFRNGARDWVDRKYRSAHLRYQRLAASGQIQKCKRTLLFPG